MKNKGKRIAAWVGIGLLLGLYLSSFLAAIFLPEYKDGLFMASLYSTIIIPIWLYAFMWFYKRSHTEDSVSMKEYRKMKKELKQKLKEEAIEAEKKEQE